MLGASLGGRWASQRFRLLDAGFDPEHLVVQYPGYEYAGAIITALPSDAYDLKSWKITPAKVTKVLEEGDIVDLGDQAFEVMHLPGHSPGSIALWNARERTLLQAIRSTMARRSTPWSIPALKYVQSTNRLRSLPVETLYAGHDGIFGKGRLMELAEQYLRKAEAL